MIYMKPVVNLVNNQKVTIKGAAKKVHFMRKKANTRQTLDIASNELALPFTCHADEIEFAEPVRFDHNVQITTIITNSLLGNVEKYEILRPYYIDEHHPVLKEQIHLNRSVTYVFEKPIKGVDGFVSFIPNRIESRKQ